VKEKKGSYQACVFELRLSLCGPQEVIFYEFDVRKFVSGLGQFERFIRSIDSDKFLLRKSPAHSHYKISAPATKIDHGLNVWFVHEGL